MPIKGYQGTSLLDYPGRIASLVFYSGCNLTCPFCHNPDLVIAPERLPDIPEEDLLTDLEARRSFVDGVVVTGGEPTCDPGLLAFLRRIKGLGLLVKLDTNGLAPNVLAQAIDESLVDYLALDVKTAPDRYGELHSRPVVLGNLEKTVSLVLADAIDYEIRTTCVPGFVTERDIHQLGRLLKGARRWVLQQYAPTHALAPKLRETEPYPSGYLEDLSVLARQYVGEVVIRGVP